MIRTYDGWTLAPRRPSLYRSTSPRPPRDSICQLVSGTRLTPTVRRVSFADRSLAFLSFFLCFSGLRLRSARRATPVFVAPSDIGFRGRRARSRTNAGTFTACHGRRRRLPRRLLTLCDSSCCHVSGRF